jgi:hypothetical protein
MEPDSQLLARHERQILRAVKLGEVQLAVPPEPELDSMIPAIFQLRDDDGAVLFDAPEWTFSPEQHCVLPFAQMLLTAGFWSRQR